MGRRIGLYGGSFDPIHFAHLILADRAREQLKLDEVWLIPAHHPPHKAEHELTSAKERIEMVELAIAGVPGLAVSDIEIRRPGLSFTVETLRELVAKQPGTEWYLLLGADMLLDFPTWKEPAEIANLAHMVVARRPGDNDIDWHALRPYISNDELSEIRSRILETPLLEISSSEIRRRCREGKSIRFLVPAAVEAYIRAHKLYSPAESHS